MEKFRVWDKQHSRWDERLCAVNNEEHLIIYNTNTGYWFQLPPALYEVSWSTGFKDKNDVELFHKDILIWDENKFVVEWDNENGMWYGRPLASNQEGGVLSGRAFKETINIGNCWENGELLDEKG